MTASLSPSGHDTIVIRSHQDKARLVDGLISALLLQLPDPTTFIELPRPVRGVIVFSLVLVLGAGIVWRYEPLLERGIGASMDHPLSALGYGVAAHLTIAFFSFYGMSQLQRVTSTEYPLATAGTILTVSVLFVFAAYGFTVVGKAVVERRGGYYRWAGLLLGATTAGVLALVDLEVGAVVWVAVVSVGIGGPVRNWFTATKDPTDG